MKKRSIAIALAIVVLVGLVAIGYAILSQRDEITIRINDRNFATRIADEPDERSRGLSGTKQLDEDQAMLFIFQSDAQHGFWMKDMNYSIDIVWLNAQQKITHIEENVSPDTYPTSFKPDEPSRYVLEFRAGTVERLKLVEGQTISFTLPR